MIITITPTSAAPPLDLSTFTAIALHPLDPSTASDLVRSVARGAELPDEVVRRIVDRCEGVPLVLEEVTRNALELTSRPDDLSAATGSGEVPVPLQLVVQSRLGRWPQFAPIVQSASVLGREFSVRLLEKMVSRVQELQVADTVEALALEGLFAQPESSLLDRARFKHVMICEAVYNTSTRAVLCPD
jgi:predicted ATPase